MASITFCFAWFAGNIQSTSNDFSGSVLESYFDRRSDGTGKHGSETNPFVITSSKHYENLVKLYTKAFYDPSTGKEVDFSSHYYYFELGKDYDGSGTYQVLEYNEYGAATGNYSTTLNLQACEAFEPIGNDAHPFNAKFVGNDITIANFTVKASANTGQSYNDIGIFGLVKNTSRVSNTYWSNFTIDASGAAAGAHSAQGVVHHDGNVRIGYLAGHIMTYESFVNCYVNGCTMKSPSLNSAQRVDYGYYGMVEIDKTGSGLPDGKNYHYEFDTEVWHNYFTTNYDTLKSQQLIMRNTKEGASSPTGEYQPSGENLANAITTGDVLSSYYVKGHTVGNAGSYTGRDYSLSTTGYVSGQRITESNDYKTKITADNVTWYDPDPSASLSTISDYNSNFNEDEQAQFHYAWDSTNKQWLYYFCDNHKTKAGDTFDIKFTFDQGSETVLGTKTIYESTFDLYLDTDTFGSPSQTWSGTWTTSTNKITWKSVTKTFSLPIGQHVVALLWHRRFKTKALGVTYNYDYYSAVIGDRGDKKCTMVDMNNDVIHNHLTNKYTVSNYDIDLSNCIGTSHTYSSGNVPSLEGQATFYPDIARPIYGAGNASVPLYYDNNGSNVLLKDTETQSFSNTVIQNKVWSGTTYVTATITEVKIDPSTSSSHYLADEKEITTSGYNYRCIDVCGGGVGFYYYNLGALGSLKICRIESEGKTPAKTVVKKISSSDLDKKFYAPGRCNQSLVLYVKNVGSAIDEVDDLLGSMSFNYYQLATRTVHPSFKKGATSSTVDYVDFSTLFGNPSQSGIQATYSNVQLLESVIKKACYCALDASGRILGTFNSDGSYGTGMNDTRAANIDTYVLVIGSFTSADYANWQLWIREIVFDFKAAAGMGGTFGSVGYRSAYDTIEDTILNFICENIASKTQYMIKVTFVKQGDGGTYTVNIITTVTLNFKFYNYYPGTYTLIVNGQTLSGNVNAYTAAGNPSTNYPNFT